jgi:hypothetical protein
MKSIALAAASALFTIAGIGIAAADDPYPVRSQGEAIAVERDRAGDFNAIQADPSYYGNNPGTHATGADAYDRSNDHPRTVIYQAPAPTSVEPNDQARAEAYDRGRADAEAEHDAAAIEAGENP